MVFGSYWQDKQLKFYPKTLIKTALFNYIKCFKEYGYNAEKQLSMNFDSIFIFETR
jgi:hypothetical protein